MKLLRMRTGEGNDVADALQIFAEKGDLAHVALFLWASAASGLLVWSLREQSARQERRLDHREVFARFSRSLESHIGHEPVARIRLISTSM
jgi:hypothetical protein